MEKPATIKDLREKTGLTQMKFAERYGLSRRTVEDWERGVRSVPVYRFEALLAQVMADIDPAHSQQPPELGFMRDLTTNRSISDADGGRYVLEISSDNLKAIKRLDDLIQSYGVQTEDEKPAVEDVLSPESRKQLLVGFIGTLRRAGISKPDVRLEYSGAVTVTLHGNDVDTEGFKGGVYEERCRVWRFYATSIEQFTTILGLD